MSRKGRRSGAKRSYTKWVILGLVAVTAVVAYYIFTQSGAGSGSYLNGTPVPPTVLDQLSGVSLNTLSLLGTGQPNVTPTKPTGTTTPLLLDGKPEVLYMGAEYCPYCAVERWAMIVALDKFGNFSGLKYMESAPAPEAFPNTPTFTFKDATYTSSYIAFVSVEQQDRNHGPLQTATADQTALLNQYNPGGSIPFLDIANMYVLTGAQFLPSVFGNANWTEIAAQLDNPKSPYALSVDVAANHLIAAICKVDGGAPSSVCSQSFAQVVSYQVNSPASGAQLVVSDALLRGAAPSADASRFAPNRHVARV
jgi:hypothetical protein